MGLPSPPPPAPPPFFFPNVGAGVPRPESRAAPLRFLRLVPHPRRPSPRGRAEQLRRRPGTPPGPGGGEAGCGRRAPGRPPVQLRRGAGRGGAPPADGAPTAATELRGAAAGREPPLGGRGEGGAGGRLEAARGREGSGGPCCGAGLRAEGKTTAPCASPPAPCHPIRRLPLGHRLRGTP